MDPTREGGLLAWQYRNYPAGHRDRRNLAVHAVTAPVFLVGCVAAVLAPFASQWLWALAAPAVTLPLVLQGRGHRLEASRPLPFRGPGDVVARLFVEQWITFPRFVAGGGFAAAWRAAGTPAERPRAGA